MGLNDLINWYQSIVALDLGFKVLWSKNEGTDEVLEGTAEVFEGTEEVHEGTAQVNESTAEVNESTTEKDQSTAGVCESTVSVIRYLRTYCLLYKISGNT
ncbi:hypothetical protein Tco_1249870 [Tanacetum coccineum]